MAKHPITRRMEFDAAHRLVKHTGKCGNYHGHRYVLDVTCIERDGLDDVGVVVDFSAIKAKVGGWVDHFLDHGMILQVGDPLIQPLKEEARALAASRGMPLTYPPGKVFSQASPKLFVMEAAPTVEHLTELLYRKAKELLADEPVRVTTVRLYETPNCWCDFPGAMPAIVSIE